MKGVATWVWIIVAVVGAVAVIYLGMSYGIIPIGGEVGKWFCYRRLMSACEAYLQRGDTNSITKVWTECGEKFFGEYGGYDSYCRKVFGGTPPKK